MCLPPPLFILPPSSSILMCDILGLVARARARDESVTFGLGKARGRVRARG